MVKFVGKLGIVTVMGVLVWFIVFFIAGMNKPTLTRLMLLSCLSVIASAIVFWNLPRKKLLFPFFSMILVSIYIILDVTYLFFDLFLSRRAMHYSLIFDMSYFMIPLFSYIVGFLLAKFFPRQEISKSNPPLNLAHFRASFLSSPITLNTIANQ